MRARHATPLALVALVAGLLATLAVLAQSFPALTGRVVDEAALIPAATRTSIETKLRDLEEKSGIQFVVATVRSLGGRDIETYANLLFRNWKLGEQKKNNGVLLLIAPNERKLRIEVGYGLEATLTDALSKIVIANAIAPRFKSGDFGGGVERGVDDVIAILTTDASEWQKRPTLRQEQNELDQWIPLLIIAFFIFMFLMSSRNARRGYARRGRWGRTAGGPIVWIPSGGSSWGGGGSSGGGGFSGGGGSSGGGGASGDW